MTIRRTPTEAEVEACLDFTPVPRIHNRHDGWTPDRQRDFIAALARLGTVKGAAAHVGMAAVGAYYLRRQKGAEEFARAWARAHAAGVAELRDIAYDRAVNGTPKGIWHKGERVGEERKYNDRLLMFMLRREAPASEGGLKLLSSGTRHPVTVAREARWAGQGAGQPALPPPLADAFDDHPPPEPRVPDRNDPTDPKSDICQLLDLYRRYAEDMQRARRAGDLATADYEMRRMVVMEIAIVLGNFDLANQVLEVVRGKISVELPPEPGAEFLARRHRVCGGTEEIPAEKLSRAEILNPVFAAIRLMARAKAGPFPTPEGFWWPEGLKSHSMGGPNWRARDAACERAKRDFADALALYEASYSEERWAAYLATRETPASGA